jgi:serine/threonine-protein kinase
MDNTQLIQELQPGTSLYGGKYVIEKKIGEGGFGITYKAVQRDLDRAVCIKEFFLSGRCVRNSQARSLHLLNLSEGDFEKYRMAFVKEARTLASLHHPNIVEVIDIFNEGNTSYMVMPFVEGRSLQSIIEKNGPLTYPEAVNYIAQIANAVGYIHDHHILHRDIKPDNIMITDDYRAVLIDFGSAREFVEDKTQSHTSILTQGFAPPEQYSRTSRKGSYTDIYAIGATLYFILTGRTPVDAAARLTESLPEPRTLKPDLPEEANSTIMKAMQLNPQNRYQSIAEFMADLCKEVAPRSSKKKTASKRNSVIPPANTLKTANTANPSQKKKKSTIAIWTGIIVLIILTGGAYSLFSTQLKDNKNAEITPIHELDEEESNEEVLADEVIDQIKQEDLQDSINKWVKQIKELEKEQDKSMSNKKKFYELETQKVSIGKKIELAVERRDITKK